MKPEFGISFSGSVENLKNMSGFLKNTGFKSLDLGGECLVPGVWDIAPLPVESVDDLISPMDVTSLMNQKDSLRNMFLDEFEKKVDFMSKGFAKFASVDFGVESCIGDMFYYGDLVGFMKKIALILLRRKMSLCLPVRAPLAVKEASCEFYRKLIMDMMLPNCLIALEIFPHDFKKKENLRESLLNYRFDIGVLRIKYELKNGNTISEKLFGEISSALQLLPSNPKCFFDPMAYEFSTFRAEMMRISDMIR